ncbi:protein YgfX [Erwinia rhapontici]|uniref:protein YgfX n=1 Tax=Erwinia rhapontici TaxID=55212 RepID=UPI0021680913|nr:protein YgfX [Erwinia rhapontici]MCS3609234.1 toxin CptA [Erwinia rhapontici]
MVRWRCNLRASRRAQTLSLVLHGTLILALLLAPWPDSVSLPRILLLLLVLLECQWRMTSRPWLTQRAIRLTLQNTAGRRERLWLFADGMDSSEWRLLRQHLLNEKEPRDE